MVDLTALLRLLNETNGSDLHLVVGAQPCIRVDGELRRVQGPVLLPGDTSGVAHVIMPPDRRERFENANEADFAYSVPGIGRFRVNAYRQRGSVTLILRRVRLGSASFAELNLPPTLRTLAELPRGLLLVTGPTGSGKTTTLAAMIDHINATKPVHILTVEDPIEVLYRHQRANVTQREVGVDTDSYVEAMRSAMRQDPDASS